ATHLPSGENCGSTPGPRTTASLASRRWTATCGVPRPTRINTTAPSGAEWAQTLPRSRISSGADEPSEAILYVHEVCCSVESNRTELPSVVQEGCHSCPPSVNRDVTPRARSWTQINHLPF